MLVEMSRDEVSAAANVVVALIAAVAIFLAWRQARDADKRLLADRQLAAAQRKAELDLASVHTVARLHTATANPNVSLSPEEAGRITASLDALPTEMLPLTRRRYDLRSTAVHNPLTGEHADIFRAVADELSMEMRRLTETASGALHL